MEVKITTRTESRKKIYLDDHDLAVALQGFLLGIGKLEINEEITTDNLDWDISQGTLMKGVFIELVKTNTVEDPAHS